MSSCTYRRLDALLCLLCVLALLMRHQCLCWTMASVHGTTARTMKNGQTRVVVLSAPEHVSVPRTHISASRVAIVMGPRLVPRFSGSAFGATNSEVLPCDGRTLSYRDVMHSKSRQLVASGSADGHRTAALERLPSQRKSAVKPHRRAILARKSKAVSPTC